MRDTARAVSVAGPRRRPLLTLQRREAVLGYLFILPWVIGFIWFQAGPILASLVFSFLEYSILTAGRWIGLRNYVKAFAEEPLFWQSLLNTAYFTAFHVPLAIILGFLVALLLNSRVRWMTSYRTCFYLPSIVPSVGSAILWLWLLNGGRGGLINMALGLFGIEPINWLGSAEWAMPSLILMSLWGIGGGMIIYLAGLQGIPAHLYEAAQIDGANFWHRFWTVTVPMMTPTIFFNLIMSVINSFQVFNAAFIMTRGGPAHATYFYMLYLYDNAFSYYKMGYASALAWVLFMLVLLFTLVLFRSSGRWVYYESR